MVSLDHSGGPVFIKYRRSRIRLWSRFGLNHLVTKKCVLLALVARLGQHYITEKCKVHDNYFNLLYVLLYSSIVFWSVRLSSFATEPTVDGSIPTLDPSPSEMLHWLIIWISSGYILYPKTARTGRNLCSWGASLFFSWQCCMVQGMGGFAAGTCFPTVCFVYCMPLLSSCQKQRLLKRWTAKYIFYGDQSGG